MENLNENFGRTDKLQDAIFILEDIDKCRNVHPGAAVFFFFASAGVSVTAFFSIYDLFLLINDAVLNVKVSEHVALTIISLAWIMIFPMWVLAFLLIFSVLGAMGFTDVQSVTKYRLSNLELGFDELHELHAVLASRNWKHGRIFESVVADLTDEPSES